MTGPLPYNPPRCHHCDQPIYATPEDTAISDGWIHQRTNRELCTPQDGSELAGKYAEPDAPWHHEATVWWKKTTTKETP